MRELEFDVDVVPPSSQSWRKSARQIFVGLCGAAFLAGAMPVVAQPMGDDDDDDDGAFFLPHHKHHRKALSPSPSPASEALAAPIIFDAPLPLVDLSVKPRLSERVRRRQARDAAEKSEFLQILARTTALEPEQRAKDTLQLAPSGPTSPGAPLDASTVDTVMRERGPAFTACYEHALKNNASLAGTFKLSFTVAARGDVKNARVEPRDDDGLGACLMRVVKRVRFEKTASAVDVSRNLRFHPGR